MALLGGGDAFQTGALSMRGVLTTIVYLAPALASSALGPAVAVWAVLAWNSLLGAVVCVVLLPRLASLVSPGHAITRIWLSAAVGGAVLSGYARFPLLDTWAVAAALAGLYALARGRRWWNAILAGIAFAAAINLRPAYLVPLAIAMAVILISRPRRVGWAIPGIALGLIPQFALNLVIYRSIGITPYATPQLVTVQAAQAAYAIRYDTVAFAGRNPQQWYCDPAYAAQVATDPTPTDQLGVVGSVFQHLPNSLWFLTEKAAASLQWTFSTPYEHTPGPGTSLMTPLVIGVAAVGVVALVVRAIGERRDRARLISMLAILGFWLGSLATLVLSTPETRFALPLVLVGLIGLLAIVPSRLSEIRPIRPLVIGLVVAIVLAVGLFGAGKLALAHPAPAGPLPSASACFGV
jgi:hypothetical protein